MHARQTGGKKYKRNVHRVACRSSSTELISWLFLIVHFETHTHARTHNVCEERAHRVGVTRFERPKHASADEAHVMKAAAVESITTWVDRSTSDVLDNAARRRCARNCQHRTTFHSPIEVGCSEVERYREAETCSLKARDRRQRGGEGKRDKSPGTWTTRIRLIRGWVAL